MDSNRSKEELSYYEVVTRERFLVPILGKRLVTCDQVLMDNSPCREGAKPSDFHIVHKGNTTP